MAMAAAGLLGALAMLAKPTTLLIGPVWLLALLARGTYVDAEGRFVERITLEADFDPERDDALLRGDRLYVIKESQMTSNTVTANTAGMLA